jgi:hypothetical protein
LYEAGATLYQHSLSQHKPIANHLRVEITSITDESIRGAISGDHHLREEPAGAKVITAGQCCLPLIKTP